MKQEEQMVSQILYEKDEVRILHRQGFSEGLLQLYEETLWGTELALHRSLDVRPQLAKIPQARSLELWVEGVLTGGRTLLPRTYHLGALEIKGFQRHALAVRPEYGGRGYGRLINEVTMRLIRDEGKGGALATGFIERGNTRSFKVDMKVSSQVLRHLKLHTISRSSPGPSDHVAPLGEDSSFLDLLSEQYGRHGLSDLQDSFDPGEYHVFREAGQVRAGAQLRVRRRIFLSLGNRFKNLGLKLTPYIPFLSRYMPKGELPALSLTNVYMPAGAEKAFLELVESLMADEGIHLAQWVADVDCPLAQRLNRFGGQGLLGPSSKDAMIYVTGAPIDLKEEIFEEIRSKPVLISLEGPS